MAKGEGKALRPKRAIERRGLAITGACILLVAVLVLTLIFMVASRGLATFTTDGIPFASFMAGTSWNPHQNDANGIPLVGALPMIAGSFSVTLLSCLIALPFALGSAIFVVEVNPTFGTRVFQPLTELLVGIPSVVFGLVGLRIIVPWTRSWAGGTGYGILSGSIVLAFMILPTVTSLSIDAIRAVPQSYRDGSYGLGCTRWQTIAHVVLPSASSGILTAVILGMTRAFGEALAVQMVVGNAAQIPTSLTTPAATLTSVITTSMGNEAMGTVYNDVLWSLALVLLIMSLVFILIIHIIGRKGAPRG
ncbi:MAG: phosphate ABC transporter permease subunit PstC [Atopobiaceae bacterium]|jgi:phosphate transport system permease protein|nr:phosphate ABC transporter permease subunit PstC [Atopobiaceae bacterium]MCH4119511.1 phosphate ABC transporter permease subunit PstC [Atopobiaceae bacterium]MCI1389604.1 phosphate ABC transporter permease subunit PstC [Atopobiaceae bacterium]MCI1431668.1 phosphate ABC transporter permease subunit PstC [Atopobiaceae bacterium]MCI1470104.1 phosphate ABC transporter permease subunit PstC [Atopobiaceae bacterium]